MNKLDSLNEVLSKWVFLSLNKNPLGHNHDWFSIKEVFNFKHILSCLWNFNLPFKFFPPCIKKLQQWSKTSMMTHSTVIDHGVHHQPWPSISVIAEMEAEEIKHSEQVGCVEAELTCWVVDLKTELCSRILNNGLREREMRHRMILLKYLKQVLLFRLLPLLWGSSFFFSILPMRFYSSSPFSPPYRNEHVSFKTRWSCTLSWAQKLIKEGSRGRDHDSQFLQGLFIMWQRFFRILSNPQPPLWSWFGKDGPGWW